MAQELVRFESAPVQLGQLQRRLAQERGETLKAASDTIEGYLSKPEGNGPFAAIVYLHGCDGLSEEAPKFIARFMTGLGYVSLAVDSLATRGLNEACTRPIPGLMQARQGDALGALSYLSKLPFVDSQRIAVLGSSQGGAVALQLASTQQVEIFDVPRNLKFRAAVTYYPLCGVASEELIVPTLILIRTRRLTLRRVRTLDEAGRQGAPPLIAHPAPIALLTSWLSLTAGNARALAGDVDAKAPSAVRRCGASPPLTSC
jgi:dienelactone hydrolase